MRECIERKRKGRRTYSLRNKRGNGERKRRTAYLLEDNKKRERMNDELRGREEERRETIS